MKYNRYLPATLADKLGEAKAVIAEMNKQVKELRDVLQTKVGLNNPVEGDLFRVNLVSTVNERTDWKAAFELATRDLSEAARRELVLRSTAVSEGVQLRVYGKTEGKSKAA